MHGEISEDKMGKPSVEMPDWPEEWKVSPGAPPDNISKGWQDFALPDGQKLKDVFWEHRSDLLNTVSRLQRDPQSMDGGLGYAAGHYLAMGWPHGPIDFKNQFKGQGDPVQLGKAGNFA